MPYEAAMSGYGPWGFRMGGGAFSGKPVTISRITPGGKAAQSNVMVGDIITAVNGMTIHDLQLTEVMQLIKGSGGDQVHLTLLTMNEEYSCGLKINSRCRNARQEEASISVVKKRQSEANITTAAERERSLASPLPPRFWPNHVGVSPIPEETLQTLPSQDFVPEVTPTPLFLVPRPSSVPKTVTPVHSPLPPAIDIPIKIETARSVSPAPVFKPPPAVPPRSAVSKPLPPTPKPRSVSAPVQDNDTKNTTTEEEDKNYDFPDYVKRQLKPQKPLPEFKPQVNWLHGKLKINLKQNPKNMSDPGNKLKQAAQAHPNQPITIEGPVSGTVVHAQYNTPVGLYSGNQIVNTLVETAAARGANVPDPATFGASNPTEINTNTPVYKMIHKSNRPHHSPAQSRSIQILDAILSHPEEAQKLGQKY